MLDAMRSDPLRALITLEWIAMISAFILDIAFVLGHVNGNPGDPRSITLFVAVFCVAAAATFACPHKPHRGYFVVAVALLACGALMEDPTQTASSLFLLLILGARLTFAFGFPGAALTWALGVVSEVGGIAWDYAMKPTSAGLAQASASAILWALVFTLFFGLIGIMSLYARKDVEIATTEERARIALDLHDSLGHGLTTLRVHLQNAGRLCMCDPDKAATYVNRAGIVTAQLLDDVRETVGMLQTDAAIKPMPLSPMLDRLRADFESAYPARLSWNVAFSCEPLGRSAITLYRVAQEALTNVIKHSKAQTVTVDLHDLGDRMFLSIEDDGRGFDTGAAQGNGLASMRSRVESATGTITIASGKGIGTRIKVSIPVERSP